MYNGHNKQFLSLEVLKISTVMKIFVLKFAQCKNIFHGIEAVLYLHKVSENATPI